MRPSYEQTSSSCFILDLKKRRRNNRVRQSNYDKEGRKKNGDTCRGKTTLRERGRERRVLEAMKLQGRHTVIRNGETNVAKDSESYGEDYKPRDAEVETQRESREMHRHVEGERSTEELGYKQ